MITRNYVFNGLHGRIDFRLAYEAFRARDPQKCKDDRKVLAELQRALESISEPVGELADELDMDLRMRTLAPTGGTIQVSQRAHEKLTACVEEAAFQAGLSMQVEDFLDRWSAAMKQERE